MRRAGLPSSSSGEQRTGQGRRRWFGLGRRRKTGGEGSAASKMERGLVAKLGGVGRPCRGVNGEGRLRAEAAELVGSWRFGRSGVLRRRGFGPGARGRRGEAFASVSSTGGGSG